MHYEMVMQYEMQGMDNGWVGHLAGGYIFENFKEWKLYPSGNEGCGEPQMDNRIQSERSSGHVRKRVGEQNMETENMKTPMDAVLITQINFLK